MPLHFQVYSTEPLSDALFRLDGNPYKGRPTTLAILRENHVFFYRDQNHGSPIVLRTDIDLGTVVYYSQGVLIEWVCKGKLRKDKIVNGETVYGQIDPRTKKWRTAEGAWLKFNVPRSLRRLTESEITVG